MLYVYVFPIQFHSRNLWDNNKMEHPTALTTLFDLTAKLTVSNQSIFEKVTECLDHKLVDYFRKLYEDGDHMIGGFEKTKSLCTIRIYDGEGCKNITINLETPK